MRGDAKQGHLPYLGPLVFWALLCTSPARAASLEAARKLLAEGKYADCLVAARESGGERSSPDWAQLEIRAQLAQGHYVDALASYTLASDQFPFDLDLRRLGLETLRTNNQPEEADALLRETLQLVQSQPRRFSQGSQLVVIGQFFQTAGLDSRQVLKVFFDRAKEANPQLAAPYLAAGNLALAKHDFQLAAEEFRQGLKRDPDSAELHLGLAQAVATADWQAAQTELQAALDANPHHVDTLLFAVDHAIDAEDYERARQLLDRIDAVNPAHATAWSYRAVLAHLAGDVEDEAKCRATALRPWTTNPAIDWLIGRKLSEKYRFAEGAGYQRQALLFDPAYLPSRSQLSQDLLRLGNEAEGWLHAKAVAQADPYDVLAHNMGKLEKRLAEFPTLRQDGFQVRMEAQEAKLYGLEVLELLSQARETLAVKYRVELPDQIVVEIFPQQQDFAIRTFGLPGGAGYLGVCFGPVITATSPAAQGSTPSNWRAVLWHEFCHVVTLTKTGNRMPRWLSEGISVYEERQCNKGWGQHMDPAYRAMALSDDLTPVSQLSSAFLRPASGEALQFAYFESSMVVEFLVQQHGFEALLTLLDELRRGTSIESALGELAGGLGKLDRDFARYFRQCAEQLAPKLDWDPPPAAILDERGDRGARADRGALADAPLRDGTEARSWLDAHPKSLYALQASALAHMADADWEGAKAPLRRMIDAYPEYVGQDNAYTLLAQCHEKLDERADQIKVLRELTSRDGDALDACLTLMRLVVETADWSLALSVSDRALGIHPLLRIVHETRARAAEELGDWPLASRAYACQLALETVDVAEISWRLARMLEKSGERAAARRRLLESIEEAPRRREALAMLLEMAEMQGVAGAGRVGANEPHDSSSQEAPERDVVEDASLDAPTEEVP